ncbi:MAG: hypothetical protein AUG51_18990 [Acidobacteria bacterium 13_1_20CM_3_53_8]|nr:MAG: hypothetical protein AUG51_18990 [Acidobacteria bacterium 13_1_20CM_3_53_8]
MKQTIVALMQLVDGEKTGQESPPDEAVAARFMGTPEDYGFGSAGLSDACREVLKASDKEMTAMDVRDALIRTGYDLSKYSNALASIHTTLKRLAGSDEVRMVESDEATTYKWIKPRPQWFERFISAGFFDSPDKESGSGESESKEPPKKECDLVTPPRGFKLQPRKKKDSLKELAEKLAKQKGEKPSPPDTSLGIKPRKK